MVHVDLWEKSDQRKEEEVQNPEKTACFAVYTLFMTLSERVVQSAGVSSVRGRSALYVFSFSNIESTWLAYFLRFKYNSPMVLLPGQNESLPP